MMFWWIILTHMAFAHLEVDEAASHGLRLDGLLYPTNFLTALSLFLLDFISLFRQFIYPLTLALFDLSFCVPMVDFTHLASHIVFLMSLHLCDIFQLIFALFYLDFSQIYTFFHVSLYATCSITSPWSILFALPQL